MQSTPARPASLALIYFSATLLMVGLWGGGIKLKEIISKLISIISDIEKFHTHISTALRISLKILLLSKGSWEISQMLRRRQVAPRSLPSSLEKKDALVFNEHKIWY